MRQAATVVDVNVVQANLKDLYERFLRSPKLGDDLAANLVCPLLLHVDSTWAESSRRLLIVGQETLDEWRFRGDQHYPWPHPDLLSLKDCRDYDKAATALTDFYNWCYHKSPWVRGTPCWDAVRQLKGRANAVSLWTNVFKCAPK